MKILNYYQCDYCLKVYMTENECKACEDNHKIGTKIIEHEYEPILENPKGYPVRLLVKFENDEVQNFVEYDMCRIITRQPEPIPVPEPEPPHSDDEDVIEPEQPEEGENTEQGPSHSEDDNVVVEEDPPHSDDEEVVVEGEEE